MRIVIVGAGTVGSNIASHLTRDRHDVIVVDSDSRRLGDLEDHLDIQTLSGNGCDPDVLKQALAGEQPYLLLAVTDQDNTNLIAAYVAKRIGVPRVVARVHSRFYLDMADVNFRDPLGIDLLLSPEILSALELVGFVENPAALAVRSLARGRLELRTVLMSPFSPFSMSQLKDLKFPSGMLIANIRRGGKTFTPSGDTMLETGDRVTLIGLPEVLDRIHPEFDTEQEIRPPKRLRVAIAGAGETGLYLAEQLEERNHQVYLIDTDRARCELAGERLHRAVMLHGDCTNIQFLREEQIHKMDAFIAATGDDESNVMSALLAKELKVDRTACLIDRPDYVRVVEKVGIDVAISPRIVAANRIMTLVKQGKIRSVTLLEEGQIEVNEYQAVSKSAIVGQPLKDIELPKGTLVGAVVHGLDVTIPRGDSIIRPGDIVIAIAEAAAADELDRLFQPGSIPER
ncbi:Trk system potassium transporter TrkA [bacterium]|nr:Trk system potassium transporter TrkA [bacterium]